ncbi:Gamma-Tubulin Complex Component 2 [Manis pentadactyla]|nr:Gamma-Tubulin Complex Component 2 [Manis pentadactyla]
MGADRKPAEGCRGSGTLSCLRRCSCLRRLSTEGQSLGHRSAQEPARLLSDRAQAAYFEGQRQWWFVFLDLLIPGFSAGRMYGISDIETDCRVSICSCDMFHHLHGSLPSFRIPSEK